MADNKSFESTLHDIVYSIDTGTGLKIIRVSLYILVLLVVVMAYTATQFRGLKTEEAMDYAQLGRNFSIQNGMQTKYVRPLSMWKVSTLNPEENAHILDHPDLFHPPAYPAVLSAGFSLFEVMGIDPFIMEEESRAVSMHAEQWIILSLNHIFAMLTGWMVFLLGKRLFSREIGLLGMTIYFLSDLVWRDSISGLNITMAVCFIMASFYTMMVSMLNKRDSESTMRWLVPFIFSILFAAIAFLTRYIAIAAVPGLCLFAWLMAGRFRGGTRFVVIFLVLYTMLVSPWLVRNYRLCGNPMGMVAYTALEESSKYPDDALARDINPQVSLSGSIPVLKQKWNNSYAQKHPVAFPGIGGGILAAFFIVTFFYHFVRPQVNYFRWGIGLSLGLMIIIAGYFSDSSVAMLHAFWPFMILYALAFFNILVDRLDLGVRLYNTGLKVLFTALAALPIILTMWPPNERQTYRPYYVPIIAKVSELFKPREILCTDMPWATAWYGDRVSILLPKDLDQFYEINDLKGQYISGLYLTAITKDKPFLSGLIDGPDKSWLSIVTGRTPADFPLKQVTSIMGQDQLLFSDYARWGSSTSGATE